jgi:hypothetical protein
MEQLLSTHALDIVVLITALLGMRIGHRRGVTQELMRLLMWLVLIYTPPWVCRQLDSQVVQYTGISMLWSRFVLYGGTAALAFILVTMAKNALQDRITSMNLFGKLEYPLGSLAGVLRYFCIIVMVLALIHARAATDAERAQGGAWSQVQDNVFEKSWSGQFVEKYLDTLLIPATIPGVMYSPPKESPKRQGQQEPGKSKGQ